MKLTSTHTQSARRHLRDANPVMKTIIDAVGPYTLRFVRDRFAMPVRSERSAGDYRNLPGQGDWKKRYGQGDQLPMTEVDFTDDLWLFLSPWSKHLEKHRYFDAIALAWVALWNYTIDPTSVKTGQIRRVCKGLFDIPTGDLIDVLKKRRAVFFPDDNRLIERYRVVPGIDDFTIYVTFAEPSR